MKRNEKNSNTDGDGEEEGEKNIITNYVFHIIMVGFEKMKKNEMKGKE